MVLPRRFRYVVVFIRNMINSDSSVSEEEPFDKIDAWFINPIRELYKIRDENSDGAFLAHVGFLCNVREVFD